MGKSCLLSLFILGAECAQQIETICNLVKLRNESQIFYIRRCVSSLDADLHASTAALTATTDKDYGTEPQTQRLQ